MSWRDHYSTSEITDLLRNYARQGLTHSQMARAIGHGISRGAVSALCWRAKPEIVTKASRRVAIEKRDAASEANARQPVLRGATPRFVIVDEVHDGIHLMKTRRTVDQCRAPLWPDRIGTRTKVSTSETVFCGRPVKAGSSYCMECHPRFYTPAVAAKRPTATRRGRGK